MFNDIQVRTQVVTGERKRPLSERESKSSYQAGLRSKLTCQKRVIRSPSWLR